jgi:hypothetical protein
MVVKNHLHSSSDVHSGRVGHTSGINGMKVYIFTRYAKQNCKYLP